MGCSPNPDTRKGYPYKMIFDVMIFDVVGAPLAGARMFPGLHHPQFLPFRLLRPMEFRILPIEFPSQRILGNVFPNAFHFFVITDDMFVIIILPEPAPCVDVLILDDL
jgi:hypothetical protein